MVKVHGRLRDILDQLKRLLQNIAVPSYVHGGICTRSILTNAAPHLAKPMLVCLDLEDHFPSTSHHKVYAMFRHQQECSPDVARILTRLTTLNGGLPQGSPTSTLVSNLVTLRLSNRLHRFASSRSAQCTQYVDDYTFSGNPRLAKCADRIATIIGQEGFRTNVDKTAIMPAGDEQVTTGIRVNGDSPDVPKALVKKVRHEIGLLEEDLATGNDISLKTIQRCEGRIRYMFRLNPGIAKPLQRRLAQIKSAVIVSTSPA